MSKSRVTLFALSFVLCIPLTAMFTGRALAVPASPDMVELSQPDGKRFKAYIRGDEFQNWVETDDGYAVAKDKKTKKWEYAVKDKDGKLVPSGLVVDPGKNPPSDMPKGLRPKLDKEMKKGFFERVLSIQDRPSPGPGEAAGGGAALASNPDYYWYPFPVSGSRNVLVILVNFNNRPLDTTASGWNDTTFNTGPGLKSLANFYDDNSFGALSVSPAVHSQSGNPAGIVTVTIASNHPNYGGSFDYAAETAWLNEALAEAANYVDFASFDTSADGIFQNSELIVYFIPAGYEASGTSMTPSIWAHAWGGSGVSAGGVALRKWAMNGELNNSNAQHPMGVIAHELGHSMCGLPDLYDTTYFNSGMGAFTVMAKGSWGRTASESYSGTTPVSLDAWSREHVAWSAPREPSGGPVSFGPALDATDAPVKLVNSAVSDTQYFLAENRYPSGWDEGMERWLGADWGGGLLVQHIDITIGTSFNDGTAGYNDINEYGVDDHQGVMVEEASTAFGSLVGNSSNGHVTHMFYDGNNRHFSDGTIPDSRLYDGTSTGLGIYSVSPRGQTMTAYVGEDPSLPVSAIASPADSAYLCWSVNTIAGTATDKSASGLQLVEVSTDGGNSWVSATDTSGGSWTSWSYDWALPAPGSYTIKSRAKDNSGNTEAPSAGTSVTAGALDETPPTGTVAINSGVENTASTTVTLALSASDTGSGVDLMRISNDGTFDTEPWEAYAASKSWELAPGSGQRTVYAVYKDLGGLESTACSDSINLASPDSELQHYSWDYGFASEGCDLCHMTTGAFVSPDYGIQGTGFCLTCHNPAGAAHERGLAGGGSHSLFADITSADKLPAYGNITSGEYNNQPFAKLLGGDGVVCATCHNVMRKTEDEGRSWEMTTTSDNVTYGLQNGGWSAYGYLVPLVYKDTSLWAGPSYSRDRKDYLVDPSEYSYDETAGTVTFASAQDPLAYVYVTLDYPYLRASSKENRLCKDCHTQATHQGVNCLGCHRAHDTVNLSGIRKLVRTTDLTERAVVFSGRSGANSFADGDGVYDGICEVCHTVTKYHRRDGTGFANHSGGIDYSGTDCTSCHDHASGFAK